MKKRFLATLATGLLVLGMSGVAFSNPLPLVTDVTLNGQNADGAYGTFSDNDQFGIDGIIDIDPFHLLAKSDGPSEINYSGFEFDLTATAGKAGSYNLSWTGGPVPQWLDFAFVEKAGPSFNVYFFDDVQIDTSPSSYNGTFTVTFQNGGGQIPKLSHLSAYGRPGTPDTPVPEPATMLLFGTGLAGLAGIARRKNKA